MRALVLTPDFPPARGGIQLLVHRLVVNFEAIEARIVALGGPGAAEFDAESGLDVRRVGAKGAGRNRSAVARLDAVGFAQGLAYRPDVTISAHIVTAPAAAAIGSVTRAPYLQYLHGDELRTRPRLARAALRRAGAAIAVSRHTRAMALEAGCPPERIDVIPPGVDLPPAAAGAEPDSRPTILTVARLVESYKGHDVMIRALRRVRETVPDARWAVLGDGPLRPSLEARAREEGVGDAILFEGSVSDAERDAWYERARVFAMPSRLPPEGLGGEGFGIVYLEAAAHGLPSIGGDVAGARDAILDGETGRLVDPTDDTAVAAAIVELLVDPGRAARMGVAARQFAESHSWPRIAARVEAALEEAAPAAARAGR